MNGHSNLSLKPRYLSFSSDKFMLRDDESKLLLTTWMTTTIMRVENKIKFYQEWTKQNVDYIKYLDSLSNLTKDSDQEMMLGNKNLGRMPENLILEKPYVHVSMTL